MQLSNRSPAALAILVALGIAAAMGPAPARAAEDWNDGGIAWRSYEEGLKEAKEKKKPVCLIFYTEWCPHCKNYSKVFHDPKVIEQSKKFVMVRLDKDKNKELSGRYAPDGEYIPRTMFLGPDGQLDASIHAPRDKFQYFYDERDPASVLGGMDAAMKKFGSKG